MKQPNRDTYLDGQQILGRVIDTSDNISRFLAHQRALTDDSRTQIYIDRLISLQNTLTCKIAEYRRQAPRKVSTTYQQYVDAGSGKIEETMEQHRDFTSLNDVTQMLLSLNEELAEELEPVSINEGTEEARDAFRNLQELVRETCREISKARSGIDDL